MLCVQSVVGLIYTLNLSNGYFLKASFLSPTSLVPSILYDYPMFSSYVTLNEEIICFKEFLFCSNS